MLERRSCLGNAITTNQDSKCKHSHGMLCDNNNICVRHSICTEVTILCFVSTCIVGLTAFSKTSAISQLYRKERRSIRRISKPVANSGRTDQRDRQLAATPASCHHLAPHDYQYHSYRPPIGTLLSKKMKLFSKRYGWSMPSKCRYHGS